MAGIFPGLHCVEEQFRPQFGYKNNIVFPFSFRIAFLARFYRSDKHWKHPVDLGGFMIPVYFITYLDHPKGFVWKFPKHVVARPIKGDLVQAADGTILKVCEIYHCVGADNTLFDEDKPYLRIELTSRNA